MNTRRLWGEIELASGLLQLGPQAQTADGGPRRRSNPTCRTDFPPYCLNFSQGLQLHRPLAATLPSTTPPRASPVVQGNFDENSATALNGSLTSAANRGNSIDDSNQIGR